MSSNIMLNDLTLMHERRSTPSPTNGSTVCDRFISFQWPLPEYVRDTETSGKKVNKSKLKYQLRYSKDKTFSTSTITVDTIWPFHNPDLPLDSGTWFWQYGYKDDSEKVD